MQLVNLPDMIGKKSGLLTITSFSHKANRINYWNVKCNCGNYKKISTGEFNRGRSPVISCGCYKPPITDLLGLKSGNLTILSFSHQKKSKSYWNCKCNCGKEKVICGESLVRHHTKSCGCLHKSGSNTFMERAKKRLLSKLKISAIGCWEWEGKLNPSGYGAMLLQGLKIQTAHRASYLLHYGTIDQDKLICHKCDNKICCNPDHLYMGTPKDNTRDAIERGLFPRGSNKLKASKGEKNQNAILCNSDVIRLRKLYENRNINISLEAEKFGVHISTIHRILKRKTWNHI